MIPPYKNHHVSSFNHIPWKYSIIYNPFYPTIYIYIYPVITPSKNKNAGPETKMFRLRATQKLKGIDILNACNLGIQDIWGKLYL